MGLSVERQRGDDRVSDKEATAIDETTRHLNFRNRSEFLRAVILVSLPFPEVDESISADLSPLKASLDRAGGDLSQAARDMCASMKTLDPAEPSRSPRKSKVRATIRARMSPTRIGSFYTGERPCLHLIPAKTVLIPELL